MRRQTDWQTTLSYTGLSTRLITMRRKWTKSNEYLWFKVICIELLLGEVRTRALVSLVVSYNHSDPSSVHVFFLAWVLALSFLTTGAGPVILLATLGSQEEDSEHEDEGSAEDYSSSSWNDHP